MNLYCCYTFKLSTQNQELGQQIPKVNYVFTSSRMLRNPQKYTMPIAMLKYKFNFFKDFSH